MTPQDVAEEKRAKFMCKLAIAVYVLGTILLISTMFTGCTITCVNTCTVGSASDTVDVPTSTEADVSPDISIPINKM